MITDNVGNYSECYLFFKCLFLCLHVTGGNRRVQQVLQVKVSAKGCTMEAELKPPKENNSGGSPLGFFTAVDPAQTNKRLTYKKEAPVPLTCCLLTRWEGKYPHIYHACPSGKSIPYSSCYVSPDFAFQQQETLNCHSSQLRHEHVNMLIFLCPFHTCTATLKLSGNCPDKLHVWMQMSESFGADFNDFILQLLSNKSA